MGLVGDIASFDTGTGAVNTLIDVPVSLDGLAGKVVWCVMTGRTGSANGAGVEDVVFSYGFGVSALSRRAIGGRSSTGANPTVTNRIHVDTGIVVSLSSSDTVNGRLDLNACTANNVQFIVRVPFTTSYRVQLAVLAGSDIANASIVTTSVNATGNIDLGVVGHSGKYFEFMTLTGALNTPFTIFAPNLGRAIPGPTGQILGFFSADAATTASDTASYCHDGGEVLTNWQSTTSLTRRYSFVAPRHDGFTLSGTEAGSVTFSALVLDGPFQVAMGSSATRTDTNDITVDAGFVPVLSSIWSHNQGESTVDTSQATTGASLGWFTGQAGAKQAAVAFIDSDNVLPSVTATAQNNANAYLNLDASGAIEGSMAIVTPGGGLPATAWTAQMSDPDPTASFFAWASFGAAAPPAATGTLVADVVFIPTGTGAIGSTVTASLPNLSAASLRPRVAWCVMVGRTGTSAGAGVANLIGSRGFTTEYSRRCIGWQSQQGVTPTSADRRHRGTEVVLGMTTTGATKGLLGVQSFDVGGITFSVVNDFAASYGVLVAALGGDALEQLGIVDWTTSNNPVAGIGFLADYLEHLSCNATAGALPLSGTSALGTIARVLRSPMTQQTVTWNSQDGVATPDTASYAYDEGFSFLANATTVSNRVTATTPNSDGFGYTLVDASGTRQVSTLAMQGSFLRIAMGQFTTPTDGTPITVDVGFVPVLTEFTSSCQVKSTQDVAQAETGASIGWFVGQGGGAQGAMAFVDPDAPGGGVSATATAQDPAACYVNLDASGAVDAVLQAIGGGAATTWTIQASDPEASGRTVYWVTFGIDAAAAALDGATLDGVKLGDAAGALAAALGALADGAKQGDTFAALSTARGILAEGLALGEAPSALAAARAAQFEGGILGELLVGSEGDAGGTTALDARPRARTSLQGSPWGKQE